MKDWKYILYVAGAVALFVFAQLASPRQFDWTVTYSHDDKNPYGAFALYKLMPTLFKNASVDHHFKTIYEIRENLNASQNIFVVATSFEGDKADTDVLLRHVQNGGTVFISAKSFGGKFRDTLDLTVRDVLFDDILSTGNDSIAMHLCNQTFDTLQAYYYLRANAATYFSQFDTVNTTVLARNTYGNPVTIRVKQGKGSFILNSTPMIFTNIYLLAAENHEFVAATLSALPDRDVSWTEFYHLGRMESGSPLRFILATEPLAWAYYITIAAILIFMVFESKRKQRIIPVIRPLQNTSLEFVSTIGNLYYQHGDHKNIAEKKIAFLLDYIRTSYLVRTTAFDEEFYEALSRKSGVSIDELRSLFKMIVYVESLKEISAEQLFALNRKIEQFFATKDD